jgi:hypothetical protein
MGGGSYSSSTYLKASITRAATKTPDFEYQEKATEVHSTLLADRVKNKPGGKLESRDSQDHPKSLPIVIGIDVTGSNVQRARVVQKQLCALMDGIAKIVPDPQVAIWANDDASQERTNRAKAAIQLSEFESDNRVDDHLRNLLLFGNGGGNNAESYDLLIYALARKVVSDSVEKRGEKGYAFLYADEPFFWYVDPTHVKTVFGDTIKSPIKIEDIIAEARKSFVIYILWPDGGYAQARDQYIKLFGKEFVIELQDPDQIVDAIVSRIQIDTEKKNAINGK